MRWATVPEWKLAVSVVPALISVLTVEFLVAPELVALLVDRLVQGVEAQPRFAAGVIMMSALTVCYVALCLALLGSCHGVATSMLPPERKRRLAVAGIATWIGFHVALVGLAAVDLQIHSVVYGAIVQVYQAAGEPVAAAMTGDAGLPGVSRHLMAILLPVAFGVAAVCSGSCHAIAIVEDAASPSRDSGQAARNAADRLVQCLIAMSALLVGSTLLLTLYFRLPLALYGAGEAGSAVGADYLDFANVASIFWGIVMTLTLVAVYAPHAIALRSVAPVPLGELLQKGAKGGAAYSVLVKRAEVVVSALAPLLAALTAQLL